MLTPPRPVAPGGKPDRVTVYARVRPGESDAAEATPRGGSGAASCVRVDVDACQARSRVAHSCVRPCFARPARARHSAP
jgi:hypothetical protein